MAKVATNQERLNELFDADPRNDTAIGKALGVSKQTISAWRSGIRSPKRSMLMKISELYGVTESWLLGWDLPEPTVLSYTGELPAADTLTTEERLLVAAYRAARPEYQAAVMDILANHRKE